MAIRIIVGQRVLGANLGLLLLGVCVCLDQNRTTLKKKWSQNGSTLEPFWKMAPPFKSGGIFSLIIMFEKKTVALTEVVLPWSEAPFFSQS